MKDYTEECYRESIKLLKENSSKFGILASAPSKAAKERNYLSVFGRDASICSMGMAVSGDKTLKISARRSLESLAKYQADNGQIAFWVKPEKKQSDFYYLGCIDSTLWWLIALKFYDKNTGENLSKKFAKQIKLAINWLACQEHPKFYLLQQNEASDWADLMPRSGFVLYSNTLWYWVKSLYKLKNTKQTKEYFNYIFDANKKLSAKIIKENSHLKTLKSFIKPDKHNPSYLSFVNYAQAGYEVDVFGNILACLVGLADEKKSKQIIKYFVDQKANQPWPIKTVLKPIKQTDKLWREYMNRHNTINRPQQYHNGAIWPFIGGFWTMLLSISDEELARIELARLAELNKKGDWEFREWFNGQSGRGAGMPRQSWNAAMYILAYNTSTSSV
jgi:glycogen debranching enzyme